MIFRDNQYSVQTAFEILKALDPVWLELQVKISASATISIKSNRPASTDHSILDFGFMSIYFIHPKLSAIGDGSKYNVQMAGFIV